MRVAAVAASIGFLAAAATAAPLFLDGSALRGEVAVRRAVYGEAPTGMWAEQARALDRVLQSLDTSSRSLSEDLRILEASARLLDRALGGDALVTMRIGGMLDEGEAIVAGTLGHDAAAVEAAPPDRPARRAMAAHVAARRFLDRSREAASPAVRARLLRRAYARIEAARSAMGSGPGTAEASADVTVGGGFGGNPPPTEFLASEGGALVTVDGAGVPSGLLLRFRRGAPGGPASAILDFSLDSGFTGTGAWPLPGAFYDMDGTRGFYFWTFTQGVGPSPNTLSIAEFDSAGGRILGTFNLAAAGNFSGRTLSMTRGVFEVTGALFRGP